MWAGLHCRVSSGVPSARSYKKGHDGRHPRRTGHNDVAHAMQVESSVQIVCKAGALVSKCRWWVLLACSELARQATKDDFSRPTGPACRLPRVALEQMLVLDLRTDMACILENERAHACLFISVYGDI